CAGLDLIAWPDLPFEERRSFATFGNPDFLAGFLVLTLPTALASFLSSKDAKDNIAYGFNFFLVVACLLTTYTRGAWIAALISLLIFIVLLRKSVFAHSKKLIIIASIFILSFAFVAFYSSSNSSINLIERLASTARITEGSAGNRLEIWKASIDAIKDRPLFGFGPDTFNLLSQKYETLRYVKMMRGNSTSDNAHNYLLQLSACIGLPATVCFVVFVLAAIYSAIHIIHRRDIEQRIMYTGLAASSAGYLIHLLFGLSLVGSSTIFWLILGAMLTQSQIVHKLNIKLKPAYIISLLAIIVVIIMNYYALTIFVADHYYLKGILTDRAGYPNQAMLYLNKSIGLYKNGKYFDEYSRYLQDLGLARQDLTLVLKGKDLAEAATNFEPDHANHWITLANAYAALTRKPEDEYFKESKKALIKALKIRPYSTTAHLLLGNIYKVEGNYNKAIEMLEFVQSVDPEEKDAYLMAAEIYKAIGKKSLALNQYLKYISLNPNDQKVQQIIQELKAN
ncbi:MAG: O-antigen ligase family protein, partial [Actinomycetota bacterium]|nr:O-antigen ligase family protein [Actinomycetota bacterium]